jgi:hypothetical protein
MSDVAMKRVAATPDAGAGRLAVSLSMVKIALATCAAFYLGGVFALTVRFPPLAFPSSGLQTRFSSRRCSSLPRGHGGSTCSL